MRKLMLAASVALCAAIVVPGTAAASSEEVLLAPNTETTVEVVPAGGLTTRSSTRRPTLTLRNSERTPSKEESAAAGEALAALSAVPGKHKLPRPPRRPTGEAANVAHAASIKFGRVLKVRHLAHARTSTYIGNHQWWGVGISQCSSGGCWFWNETEYTYKTWYNGNTAWIGGGAWMDPWHCNGDGFACTVNWYGWTGWNPAPYGGGEYLGAHTSFTTHFSFPWGGIDASHWLEEHFYGDGYVGYHAGG